MSVNLSEASVFEGFGGGKTIPRSARATLITKLPKLTELSIHSSLCGKIALDPVVVR